MIKWTDINEIAIELADNHTDIDPQYINFVDLRNLVLSIEDFSDIPTAVVRKFSKPFKWRGLKSWINLDFT